MACCLERPRGRSSFEFGRDNPNAAEAGLEMTLTEALTPDPPGARRPLI
jgi:hypothetical protein